MVVSAVQWCESAMILCLNLQSCPTLWEPMDRGLPVFTVHRIRHARILEWVAFGFSRDIPSPGIKPESPALQVDSLPSASPGKRESAIWISYMCACVCVYIDIYIYISTLLDLPPDPYLTLQVITEHQDELPTLYWRFPLAISFMHGSAFMSNLIFQFIPPSSSASFVHISVSMSASLFLL